MSSIKWCVERQAQVGAGAFQIIGHGEGPAKNSLPVGQVRSPSKTKARLEVLGAVSAVIEGSAGTILVGLK